MPGYFGLVFVFTFLVHLPHTAVCLYLYGISGYSNLSREGIWREGFIVSMCNLAYLKGSVVCSYSGLK